MKDKCGPCSPRGAQGPAVHHQAYMGRPRGRAPGGASEFTRVARVMAGHKACFSPVGSAQCAACAMCSVRACAVCVACTVRGVCNARNVCSVHACAVRSVCIVRSAQRLQCAACTMRTV